MRDQLLELFQRTEDALASAQRVEDLREAGAAACEVLGFERFFIGLWTPRLDHSLQAAVGNFPQPFMAAYLARGMAMADPILDRVLQGPGAFDWDELDWSGDNALLRAALADAGVIDGMACATFGPNETLSGVGLGSATRLVEHALPRAQRLAALAWLGQCVHQRAVTLMETGCDRQRRVDSLTDRERDCLRRFARGQTAAAIAREMHVTARTVTFYLDRIAEKLGASNHREAVYCGLGYFRRDPANFALKIAEIGTTHQPDF